MSSISGNLNPIKLGMPASYATNVTYSCAIYSIKGVMQKNCRIEIQKADSTYVAENFITGWYTCKEPTCLNPRPYYQQKDGYNGVSGFSDADCI